MGRAIGAGSPARFGLPPLGGPRGRVPPAHWDTEPDPAAPQKRATVPDPVA